MPKNRIIFNILRWWACSKLPDEDVFGIPLLKENNLISRIRHFKSQWFYHPIRRRVSKLYLRILKKYTNISVIAVTGSAGKTSTTKFLEKILQQKGPVVCSATGIDSVYNIPNTILRCRWNTKYLILEMSVEYPGEMDFYIWLAKPDISIITNINPTHLEYFKDVDGVFSEKIKIASQLDSDGILILNHNDKRLSNYKNSNIKIIKYGRGCSCYAENIERSGYSNIFALHIGGKKTKVHLPTYGSGFIENALAASSAAFVLEVGIEDIKRGLEKYTLPEHRMNIFKERHGTVIIDDTYNNNPAAAKESLKTLEELSVGLDAGLVFGDMLELGKDSKKYHRDIGSIISKMKIKFCICVGHFADEVIEGAKNRDRTTQYYSVGSSEDVPPILEKYLRKNVIVLIKGSRSIGLDVIVSKLSKQK